MNNKYQLKRKIKLAEDKIQKIKALGGLPSSDLLNELKSYQDVLNTPKENDQFLELQKKFEKERNEIKPQIQEYVRQAQSAINKAIELSEKTGIPFSSSLREMHDDYLPDSFKDKWKELIDCSEIDGLYDDVRDFLATNGVRSLGENCGWQQSQIC